MPLLQIISSDPCEFSGMTFIIWLSQRFCGRETKACNARAYQAVAVVSEAGSPRRRKCFLINFKCVFFKFSNAQREVPKKRDKEKRGLERRRMKLPYCKRSFILVHFFGILIHLAEPSVHS